MSDGGIGEEVKFRMDEVGKVCGKIRKMIKCKSLGMNAKRSLYYGIVVLTALYGPETFKL